MTFPPGFTYPHAKMQTAHAAAEIIARVAPARRTVVQAGGCSGLWPLALSKHFERVYTFEPNPENFACLTANVADTPTIIACACALGDRMDSVGLTRPKPNAGLWRVEHDGPIPMIPLDAVMGHLPVDALVLDVEGSELAAWRGAEQIIATYHPMLWFEYLHHTDEIDQFLRDHGYGPPMPTLGADCYSVYTH